MVQADVLWETKVSKPFLTLTYGRLFQEDQSYILTGCEDGVIQVYEPPNQRVPEISPVRSLETKCGPIFHLRLHDIIRLKSKDLIAADSRGSVTVFCNGQIFMRTMLEKPAGICDLQIYETALGHLSIVTGNEDGVVSCFNAFNDQWKIRMQDIVSKNIECIGATVSVTCILTTAISSESCPAVDYVVVADTNKNIHFIRNGQSLLSIKTPSVVKAMCAGYFLHFDEVSDPEENLTQIALGCDDGTIWICVDFEIQTTNQFADVGHPITDLRKLPPMRAASDTGNINDYKVAAEKLDILLCTGHFPAFILLREGEVLTRRKLPDWASSICDYNDDDSGRKEAISFLFGCKDSSIQAVKVT